MQTFSFNDMDKMKSLRFWFLHYLRSRPHSRFEPFVLSAFTYSGTYDPTEELIEVAVEATDYLFLIIDSLEHLPSQSLVPRGAQSLLYTGLHSSLKVDVEWVMGDGSISWQQVRNALGSLDRDMARHPEINEHPSRIEISQNGDVKIRCTTAIEQGIPVSIGDRNGLRLRGISFGQRRLPIADVVADFRLMLAEVREPSQFQPVRANWRHKVVTGGVASAISLYPQLEEELLQIHIQRPREFHSPDSVLC